MRSHGTKVSVRFKRLVWFVQRPQLVQICTMGTLPNMQLFATTHWLTVTMKRARSKQYD